MFVLRRGLGYFCQELGRYKAKKGLVLRQRKDPGVDGAQAAKAFFHVGVVCASAQGQETIRRYHLSGNLGQNVGPRLRAWTAQAPADVSLPLLGNPGREFGGIVVTDSELGNLRQRESQCRVLLQQVTNL